MTRLLPAAILLAGLVGTVAVSGEPNGENFPEPTSPKAVGLAGCASANCHGRSGDDASANNSWRTSCSIWAARDPHARAYDLLDPQKNAIAKKMQAAFARIKPGYHPQKDPNCLACHANPGIEKGDKAELVTLRAEGVSCEACHGNAEYWLHSHTVRKDPLISPPQREHHPVQLNDLSIRAKTCAGCHVGGTGDMNHDMIAAGHPKLNFEFASHLARIPKHWGERDRQTEKPRGPGYLLQAWVSGVFAAGGAACELSGMRSDRELAEWNCYACHHDLLGKPWRPESGFKLGTKAWNFPWPLGDEAAANSLVEGLGTAAAGWAKAVSDSTGDKRIESLSAAKDGLTSFRKKPSNEADAGERMFKAVEATKTLPDWDTAYRMYLTLGVLEEVRRKSKKTENAAIAEALKDVEKALNLPGHPKEAMYDPAAVQKAIQKLTAELRAEWRK